MPALVTHFSVGTSPTDVIPAGNALFACVIKAETGSVRVQIDADASTTVGELVASGASVTINNIIGRRVSVAASSGTVPVTVREVLF
jgi:hypothetical protein